MAKRVSLVLPDHVYQHLLEVAAATESTLSSTASTGIESLFWMKKQQEEGFTIKAEKQEKDKIIIKELSIT